MCSDLHKTLETCYMHTFFSFLDPTNPRSNPEPPTLTNPNPNSPELTLNSPNPHVLILNLSSPSPTRIAREQPPSPPPVHPHFPPATAKTDEHQLVAGGDGDTSLLQPAWHPTSGALYFLSDASGWYNMQVVFLSPAHLLPCAAPHYSYISDISSPCFCSRFFFFNFFLNQRVASIGETAPKSFLAREADFGGSAPGWSLGQQG